jgi:hypothetical protein
MELPMVWITNAKDRSPAELMWIPAGTWGSLAGSLLNFSYGTGKIFAVPHEEVDGVWQGAVCELPMPGFPTGVMRGRFGDNGWLYTCGMFAWAGSATTPGGLYRIRRTEVPAHVPLKVAARKDSLEIVLSEPLAPDGLDAKDVTFRVWSLKRSANYGSPHVDEKEMAVSRVVVDGNSIIFTIPGLQPTMCYELEFQGQDSGGNLVKRNLHGTIHRLE